MFRDDARQIDATYEAVMNDEPLRSVLARSLNRKNLDLVDQFLKDNGCQRLHRHITLSANQIFDLLLSLKPFF